MTVAVLDIGKTNVKLSAVHPDGHVLETLSTPNVSYDRPPYRHADLDGLERWLLEGLGDLARRHRIDTVVVCGHGSAGVLVDGDGPVMPMIDYEQAPPPEVDEAYSRDADPYAVRGSAIMHGATHQARQMLWLEMAYPDAFARARHYLGLPQYWAFRLSGVAVSEVTILAAQSHLWDTPRRRYAGIVERRGWERLMAPLAPSWRRVGKVRPELARRYGLPAGLGVLAGIHDSSANRYRYRAAGLGEATVLSTGTWLVGLGTAFDPRLLREDIGMTCNADIDGNPVAGALAMGGREFAHVAGSDNAAAATIEDVRRLVAGGTFALPSFGSDDGLFPGSSERGVVEGPLPETPAGRRALALLYCALLADACLDALQTENDVVLDGSFVRDPLFPALVAALRPSNRVRYNLDADGIAAGAALLATHETRWGPAPIALKDAAPAPIEDIGLYRRRWLSAAAANASECRRTGGR